MVTATRDGHSISPVTNDAEVDIVAGAPYVVRVEIEGTAALLFHRYSNEAVASKAAAAKNSKAKKTDNVESYVYRTKDNHLAAPGEWIRMALVAIAKFKQDPRSPRKSASDLYKAAIVVLTELASLGTADWDYLDRRRVMVQRNGITRERPAMFPGWRAQFDIQVLLPEYIASNDVLDALVMAGRINGLGDFRPTYGRFQVTRFELLPD